MTWGIFSEVLELSEELVVPRCAQAADVAALGLGGGWLGAGDLVALDGLGLDGEAGEHADEALGLRDAGRAGVTLAADLDRARVVAGDVSDELLDLAGRIACGLQVGDDEGAVRVLEQLQAARPVRVLVALVGFGAVVDQD